MSSSIVTVLTSLTVSVSITTLSHPLEAVRFCVKSYSPWAAVCAAVMLKPCPSKASPSHTVAAKRTVSVGVTVRYRVERLSHPSGVYSRLLFSVLRPGVSVLARA